MRHALFIPHLSLIALLAGAALPVRAQPAELRRVLRNFDFEERALGNPEDLPMHWIKVTGPGLPHYVNGRLTLDAAHGGKYSFRFDLDGGSLIYRYPPGQIKVQTGAHYRIEGYCRTTALPNARARITAYFTDLDRNPLPETVHHSELYAAADPSHGWERLSVELSAESPKAAFLVLELGLLQPQIYAPPVLGRRTLNVQDINGSAWFDDITVSQVPQVQLATDRPGNIFRRGEPVRLRVRVDDRFTEDLAAQLVIHDAAGRRVYQRSGALDMTAAESIGPGRKRATLDLPELAAGWYQASLVMSSQEQALGAQTLSFIQLADTAQPTRPDPRFGFIATSLPFEAWKDLPTLLPLLSGGRVKLAMWGPDGDILEQDAVAFDALLGKLQSVGITPTACLLDLPPTLAAKLAAGTGTGGKNDAGLTWADGGAAIPPAGQARRPAALSQWPRILSADPAEWEPQLAYIIARHANHLDRWQIGRDGSDAFTDPKMRQVYGLVYREFGKLVQRPDLAMPWPAWNELDGELPAAVALSIPAAQVLPNQIPLYVQDLTRGGGDAGVARPRAAETRPASSETRANSAGGHDLSLSLEWLDRDKYGRDVQIRDVAQRVIYALSADARRIDLPLPLSISREGDLLSQQPQELLLTTRTLIKVLSGTTFKGKVPVAEGVEAFLFDKGGQGILAIWDRGSQPRPRELALNLGEHPVCVDLWGNSTPLLRRTGGDARRGGEVKLTLGATPVFLVDIDGYLAQTRASVALDRPLIESSFKPHSRRVRFTNAYPDALTGTLRLRPPIGWTLTPPTFQLSLNAGETFDREISIELPYNTVAGAKTIEADFVVQGERSDKFTVPISVNVGLSDVGMQTTAMRSGSDVIVQQTITNYGDAPISYDAFALYPGQARQERLVSKLGPGKATMKRYRFSNVVASPGAKVKVGVKEEIGTRVLNDEVEIQ